LASKHHVGFWCRRRPRRPLVQWKGLERICGLRSGKGKSVDGSAKEGGSVEQIEAHGEKKKRNVQQDKQVALMMDKKIKNDRG
jgi:hypothetical protein